MRSLCDWFPSRSIFARSCFRLETEGPLELQMHVCLPVGAKLSHRKRTLTFLAFILSLTPSLNPSYHKTLLSLPFTEPWPCARILGTSVFCLYVQPSPFYFIFFYFFFFSILEKRKLAPRCRWFVPLFKICLFLITIYVRKPRYFFYPFIVQKSFVHWFSYVIWILTIFVQ